MTFNLILKITKHNKIMKQVIVFCNIPNILTSLRICAIPIICVLLYINNTITNALAIAITVMACLTDFIDGKMARKYNIISPFGRCMDPIADKLLVMALIVMLVYNHKIWIFPAIIVLCREIFISGIREFFAKNSGLIIHVSKLAKLKTAIQMISLIMIMIFQNISFMLVLSNILFTIAGVLTIITAVNYTIYSAKQNKAI